VIIRAWAELKSSLPYDGVENEAGTDFIQWPGRGVATALAEIFQRFGCDVEAPEAEGEQGWSFGVKANGRRFWCQVTMIEDYLIGFENPSWFDKFLGRTPPAYLTLLRGLAKALEEDARFSDVRWFRREDLSSHVPGSPRPLDPQP
jgi:hypothetical protein